MRSSLRVFFGVLTLVSVAVTYEVLPVRSDAEWNPGNLFQEDSSVRCAIGEMDVHMVNAVACEKICEIESVARAQLCLRARAVFLFVLTNKVARPFAARPRCLFRNFQNFLRRRVMNGRAQARDMFMPKSREWRMHRSDCQFQTEPLQGQHLRVAKRLRNHGIA